MNNTEQHRRLYTTLFLGADLKDQGGILHFYDAYNRIVKDLAALAGGDEKKLLTQIVDNKLTSTKFAKISYPGQSPKIQENVDAIANEALSKIGIPTDRATGNLLDAGGAVTNKPSPLQVSSAKNQNFREFTANIYNARTRAAIAVQVLKAGGKFNFDKETNLSKWLIPDRMTDLKKKLLSDVETSNADMEKGYAARSALSDGVSTMPEEKLAKAQNQSNRRRRVRNFVENNPTDSFSVSYLMAKNRGEKEVLEDKFDSYEKKIAIGRRLDKRKDDYNKELAWAKENKKHPIAKAILRSHRNRTFGGRALNRAMGSVRRAAIGTAVGVISAAVGAMVKFLSSLPDIARDVAKLVSASIKYNIPIETLREYDRMGQALFGDKKTGEDVFRGFLGTIVDKAGSMTDGNIESILGRFVGLSSKVGGASNNAVIGYFQKDSKTQTDDVMKAAINDFMKATFGGITLEKEGLTSGEAFRGNIKVFENAYGSHAAQLATELFAYMDSPENRATLATAKRSGDYFGTGRGRLSTFPNTNISSSIDNTNAIAGMRELNRLRADAESVRAGILTHILANIEPVVSFLRQILRAVLNIANKVTDGQFQAAVDDFNIKAAADNALRLKENELQLDRSKEVVNEIAETYGFTSRESMREFSNKVEKGIMPTLPDGTTPSRELAKEIGAHIAIYEHTLSRNESYKSDAAIEGTKDIYGGDGLDAAKVAQRYLSRSDSAHFKLIDEAAEMLERYGGIGESHAFVGALRELDDRETEIRNNNGYTGAIAADVIGEWRNPGERQARLQNDIDRVEGLRDAANDLYRLTGQSTADRQTITQYRRGITSKTSDTTMAAVMQYSLMPEVREYIQQNMQRITELGTERIKLSLTPDHSELTILLKDRAGSTTTVRTGFRVDEMQRNAIQTGFPEYSFNAFINNRTRTPLDPRS